MPQPNAQQLRTWVVAILSTAAAPPDKASSTAQTLVDFDLTGCLPPSIQMPGEPYLTQGTFITAARRVPSTIRQICLLSRLCFTEVKATLFCAGIQGSSHSR